MTDEKLDKRPHPKDSPNGYKTDLQVMRWDAKQWFEAADHTHTAATHVHELELKDLNETGPAGAPMVNPFPGIQDFLDEYQKLQKWVGTLLSEGSRTMSSMSDKLNTTAATYHEQELATAKTFHGILPEARG